MEPHQERVVLERAELNEKRIKLISFIETADFAALNGAEKDRLRRQASAMTDYYSILCERIGAFRPTPPGPQGPPFCPNDKHVA